MTTLAPILAVLAMLPFALASSPPEMAAHLGERPPNPPAYVYQLRIIESAPFPSARAEPPPPSDTTAYEPPAPSAASQRVTGAVSAAGVEQWRPLVGAIFPPENVDAVLSVMRCESGGDPEAVSPTDDHGLMQINRVNHVRFQWLYGDAANPYDPVQNLVVAAQISQDGTNFWAWTCKPRTQ